jgi:AraC-like DNA-binding protein
LHNKPGTPLSNPFGVGTLFSLVVSPGCALRPWAVEYNPFGVQTKGRRKQHSLKRSLRRPDHTSERRNFLAIWRQHVTLRAMPEPYSHRVRCLLGIPELIAACGVKPGVVLARAGLPPLPFRDPDAWLPRRSSLALVNQAARATGNTFLGLHVGAACSLDQCGAWGKAVQEAPTLRAALNVACRRINLLHTGSQLALHEGPRTTLLEFRFLGRTYEDSRHYVEGTLAVAQKVALLAQGMAVSVCFAHDRPPAVSELERVLGPRISFSRPTNGLILESARLDEPLPRATVGTRGQLGTPVFSPCENLVQAVLQAIEKLMPYGRPTVQDTAAAVGLHVRTLERRLDRWGVPYKALLDQVRRTRAHELLRTGRYSILDIALLLGYSENAHFTRAFRRWTGLSPRQYAKSAP